MRHKKLSKSPITYVLAQVQFASVELIEKYIPEIQDRLRHDFPLDSKLSIQTYEIREGEQPIPSSANQWHFSDKENVTGVLVDGKSITIHTSKHDCFDTLSDKLQKVLNIANEVLGISLTLRLGVRYINVIDSHIDEYVDKGLLGLRLKGKSFDKEKYLIDTELSQKSDIGSIRVKATLIGNKDVILKMSKASVPLELMNLANYLSFSHQREPEGKFMLLDIDHSCRTKDDFSVDGVISQLKRLQDDINLAFHEVVTKDALKAWE